jgi:DNA-binding LytR/AlgR family response regulator
MKPHILIVEDEPVLYERLRRLLVKENFSIAEYTKSFDEAILQLKTKTPDLVLLDINLFGEKDGIDLGEELFKTYKIPFIYVTDFADDVTFKRALRTCPKIFEVKTKPQLDSEHLLRSIKTVLQQQKTTETTPCEGIMVYVDYLDKIKLYGKNEVTRVPIAFNTIAYVTTEAIKISPKEYERVRDNYVRIETIDNKRYFYKTSLKGFLSLLPYHFIRINESTIVNLRSKSFEGRINGTKLAINKQQFVIKETYAKEVKKRLDSLFQG